MSGTDLIWRVGERRGKSLGLHLNLTLVTSQVLLQSWSGQNRQARGSAGDGEENILGAERTKTGVHVMATMLLFLYY